VALSQLTAQLPAHAGALPDLFRRNDALASRSEDPAPARGADDPSREPRDDEQRALSAGRSDDTTRMLARRAALGPITYGRRMESAGALPSAPIGMRGAHLDVRG
jgi:hypothetical protein